MWVRNRLSRTRERRVHCDDGVMRTPAASGLAPNVIYFGSGRGASRPVEVLKTLAIHRRACALPLKSSRFVPK